MMDRDTLERFETTAPRLLRLIAALGGASGRGDITREGWAFMPDGASPVDVAQAYRGRAASARRLVRGMGSPSRVEFGAWLYNRHARHRCHVPLSVLRETLLALSEAERQQLASMLGGPEHLAAGRIVAAMAGTQALWSCCRQLHAEWEAEAARAEIVRQVSRPLGALDDAAEALRCVFAPQKSAGGNAL